ncbi:dihydroorotate dehydrogenase [Fervidibacter sacchari]|uniref:Dihydroorotate dehydrogenase n=1 Tax=Candidatus Fervidibacter sacchari TaxID=1448929 RepID=A0ABT2EQ56_9BACT|nr:dihydroorotate dehydrogenase [Candidatus Fervidibacter sacchari]MCS3920099.1 dihydroorotate dehydrogenase (NAD+) catalytic subunit [Candidatus Fervidibacter sacchari]WKU16670.1 dihydroorotate dehydrogenase [Candidatus Fervidibacter sacchari]
MPEVNLSVSVTGLNLRTPLILASGCCGYGEEMERIEGWQWDCVGAVVLKGVTLNPRIGNPPPRITETTAGMLNSIGLQNVGVKELVRKINERLWKLPAHIIANANGETVDEYVRVCEILTEAEAVKAVELNISCPNVQKGGIEFGQSPETAAEVVRSVRSVWQKPLWVKLSPEPHNIAEIAEACVEAGADALCLCNTFPAMAVDPSQLPPRPMLGTPFGGLSGPAIKPIIVRKVFLVAQSLRQKGTEVPIVGIGGIWSGRDVLEYLAVGATAVQIGTVLFSDPLAPVRIVNELKSLLQNFAAQTGDERWLDIRNFIGSVEIGEGLSALDAKGGDG